LSQASELRLFVAAYPPPAIIDELFAALSKLGAPEHRLTAPEQVHMTLQFIGEVPARELPGIEESVLRSAAGLPPFTLKPRRLVTLPERGRPRLIAVETDAPPSLMELQRRLASRLARRPRGRAEERFRPHLTLCRFGPGVNASPVDHPVVASGFRVEHVLLMSSVLLPDRAEHREVFRAAMGAG
jgi:2'-5' RNA ligase